MNDSTDAACGADAVCCLYLARVAERLGHPKAARRWYEKADRWLRTVGPRERKSSMEVKNRSHTTRPLH